MAEPKNLPPINEPLFELTQEVLERIDKLGADLDESDRVLKLLEEGGFEMSRLRGHLEGSKQMRDIVLKAARKK